MTKNIETTNTAIVEAINIDNEIEGSFAGSLSTGKLIAHFSTITTPAECMDQYTSYCHSQRGWKRKVDIGIGKSKVACGWQALSKWASMVLLSELALWNEDLPVKERNALVKLHWIEFKNTVAKRCFRNAIVYNNMASMRCKPTANKPGQTELADLADESAENVVETAKNEEKAVTITDSLELIVSSLKAVKKVAEIESIVSDLEKLLESLKN